MVQLVNLKGSWKPWTNAHINLLSAEPPSSRVFYQTVNQHWNLARCKQKRSFSSATVQNYLISRSRHESNWKLEKGFTEREEAYTKLYCNNEDRPGDAHFLIKDRFREVRINIIDLDSDFDCGVYIVDTLSRFEGSRKTSEIFWMFDLCLKDENSIGTFSRLDAVVTSAVDLLVSSLLEN